MKSRVFNVLSYGAVGDDKTDNTEAFLACLKAVVAAGGGRMVLPDGVYQGRITIPPVSKPLPSWITVEIVGESEPTPVFGTIGSFPLQNNGSIVKSLSTIRITMNRYPTISRRGDVLKAATAN
ncbi:MAG: glycosyl hydrolase family 28-related protein [Verrucomicrobiota bacterium]